jgi:putative endonuclease
MKQIDKQGLRNKVGGLGELIVTNHLQRQGYTILDSNYLQKWGEIDIVAHETGTLHFVEVKTVSYETKSALEWAISHETWRPEENVHREKLKRLGRTIETWLLEKRYTEKWQLDVAIVRLVRAQRYATVKFICNVIID